MGENNNTNKETRDVEKEKSKVPFSLFNSKALFNPFQYKPFFEVFDYNQSDKRYDLNDKNILIADEVGVGKTFEAGIIINEILENDENTSVLILCPVKLCENWQTELLENFDLSFNNYRSTKILGKFNIVPYSYFNTSNGNGNKTEIELELELEETSDDQILNEKIKEKINELSYDVLILDEAHYIRNKGKLHKSIEYLISQNEKENKNKLKIFMTATPIFNSIEDYNNITKLIKPFKTTRTLQAEANCYDYTLKIDVIKSVMDDIEDEIFKEINSCVEGKAKYGSRTGFLKRIATSSIHSLKCFLDGNDFFSDEEYYSLDDDWSYDVNNGIKAIADDWFEEDDSKYPIFDIEIDDLKEKAKEQEIPFKVIVFSTFIHTCEYLQRRLQEKNENVYIITGKDSPKKVEEIKVEFEKAENAILVCSDALKEGHNLQFCQYMIHYDFPYTPAALQQRNGRIYRKGQEHTPEIYYMFLEDSYDERLFGEIIVEKTNIVNNAAYKELVCDMNVLPQYSDKLYKKCLEAYWDYRIEQRRLKDKNDFEKLEYRLQLTRKFKIDNKWISSDYENKYNQEYSDYKAAFLDLFKFENGDNSEILLEANRAAYFKAMKDFINKVFEVDENAVNDLGEAIEMFKSLADNYIGEANKTTKYCQDMLTLDSGVTVSLSEYKEQFVPYVDTLK